MSSRYSSNTILKLGLLSVVIIESILCSPFFSQLTCWFIFKEWNYSYTTKFSTRTGLSSKTFKNKCFCGEFKDWRTNVHKCNLSWFVNLFLNIGSWKSPSGFIWNIVCLNFFNVLGKCIYASTFSMYILGKGSMF